MKNIFIGLLMIASIQGYSQVNNSSTNNGNTTQRLGGNTAPGFRVSKETPRNATNTNTAQHGNSGEGRARSAQTTNGTPATLNTATGTGTTNNTSSINNGSRNRGTGNSSGRSSSNSANQNSSRGNTSSTNTGTDNSPFVSGIHSADNAKQHFDSVPPANPNRIADRTTTNATIIGGNDTTFNVNTINQGGITTTSGAVDRSGQSQFGQTNWGESRRTIGASQWTVPPPITASFSREFPQVSNATWSRNNVDTSMYSARYQSGAEWVTRNYSASGTMVDMRTEIPLVQQPRPVAAYMAKQPAGFKLVSINRLEIPGKPIMYELISSGGKRVYLNNEGMEVSY